MITLASLPYQEAALEPVISARTVHFHYEKHHAGYVKKTNELMRTRGREETDLVTLIRKIAHEPSEKKLFNNAAQAWNHDFYWQSLKPGGSHPKGELMDMIDHSFGNFEGLKQKWITQAMAQFGSGWVWLCRDKNGLVLHRTANAGTPIIDQGVTPLLTIDVWEHAYYLDYQNRRKDHVAAIIDDLLNWDFAQANSSGDAERVSQAQSRL